jgi:hypothetical protein
MDINRIFISIPEIRHNIDNININVYSYNKQKLYLLRIFKILSKKFIATNKIYRLNHEKLKGILKS